MHEANGHGANIGCISQHMHSVHGRRLGVIPSKRAFSERFESSREVVVHVATVVEVVVLATVVVLAILATVVVHLIVEVVVHVS